MERDQFRVETTTVEETATSGSPEEPLLRIQFDGPRDRLRQVLSERFRDDLTPDEIDVSFRHLPSDEETTEGIVALSDRVTGRFILEAKTAVDPMHALVQTVRESTQTENDAQYRVAIQADAEASIEFKKDLLLIYDATGTLLRDVSLIPAGVGL